MKIKTLIVTIAALAILSIIVFVARRPDAPPSTDARIGLAVVEPSLIDNAAEIRLVDQGKTVTLRRDPDGSWRVTSYHDFPADFSKLSQFASSVSEGKIVRLVSARPDVISRLEFKDSKIILLDDTGKQLWSATLGKQAESGGRYVRFGSESKAYLANLNLWLDTEPKNWANSQLLSIKPDDIASLEIAFPEGSPITLHRAKKDAPWIASPTPEGQQVKTSAISSLLNSLTALRFTDTTEPSDEKAAAAKPYLRTHKLTTFDGKTFSIALGRVPETKKLKTPTPTGATPNFAKNLPVDKDGSVKPPEPAKPTVPEFEIIPAGPVFIEISCSDEKAPINAMMQKRAFETAEYSFTSLPQKTTELFETKPAPTVPAVTPPTKPQPKPTEAK